MTTETIIAGGATLAICSVVVAGVAKARGHDEETVFAIASGGRDGVGAVATQIYRISSRQTESFLNRRERRARELAERERELMDARQAPAKGGYL